MTPEHYCEDRLAETGASAHYCLLFLDPDRRRPVAALFVLQRALDDAVENSSDPVVAHSRLAWWAQELGRLFEGNPQHPVTRALAPYVTAHGLSYPLFEPALAARHAWLQMTSFDDVDSLHLHCAASSGVFGQLAATICGLDDAAARARGSQIAMAVRLVRLLRDAGRHARNGRIVFPAADLKALGMTPMQLVQGADPGHAADLMRLQAKRARQWLGAAVDGLRDPERRLFQPCLILGLLYETLLREIELGGFRVLDQRIALTPLRKLMLAWRVRVFGLPRGSVLT
jgi:phytoene synthase